MSLTAVEYAQCPADDASLLTGVPLKTLGDPPYVGFLFCVDEDGGHWTVATGDQDVVQNIKTAQKLGNNTALARHLGLALDESRFPVMREGWPDEWVDGASRTRGDQVSRRVRSDSFSASGHLRHGVALDRDKRRRSERREGTLNEIRPDHLGEDVRIRAERSLAE
jgi:hypothetical protein